MIRSPIVILVFLLGISITSQALAQVPKRSLRLDLSTDIIQFHFGGWNPAGPEDWRHMKFDGGIGNPNAKLGIGVTVADALAIGLHIAVAYDKGKVGFDEEDSDVEEEEVTTNFDTMAYTSFRWGVMPYLEYAFLQNVVRPFIMFTLGFEGEVDETTYMKTTYWDFIFGLGGGLHFFASPAVSIDLGLLLGFSAGGGNSESKLDPRPRVAPPEMERFTRILFRLSGFLGISGWF